MFSFDQAAHIKKSGFAHPGSNQLQAGDRNGLTFNRDRYCKRRVPRTIHRNGVLHDQHPRFEKRYFADGRNQRRQSLESWESDEVNFFENLVKSMLPECLPFESSLVQGWLSCSSTAIRSRPVAVKAR
jgi:hypothetical protein